MAAKKIVLAACLSAVISALPSVAAPAAADGNSDVAQLDATTPPATLKLSANDQKRVKELQDAMPKDHMVEVECTTVAPGGEAIRHICRLTTLNAKGKPDGLEVNYGDWYRHASRTANYKDGLQDGVESQFDVDKGLLLSETPWVAGRIDGLKRTFYPNGKLANETTYEKGVIKGVSRSYTIAGQLSRTVNFVNGVRDGDSTDYWPDKADAVERVIPYHKGKVDGVAKAFYLNGKLKWERPFKNNSQHGIEKQYGVDGTIEKSIYWLSGNQVSAEEYQKKGGK